MNTQRIYLVGAGVIARSHAAAIQRLPRPAEVTLAVADPNPQARAAFARDYPQARIFEDARRMLAEAADEDDIVIVTTPPFAHEEMACVALTSGRHVLCEKPLALNLEQARHMLEVARTHQRVLGCCSVRCLNWPPAEEARRLLQTEALGQLYHARFLNLEQRNRPGIEFQPQTNWFLDQARSGGGTLMDRAPYELAVLNDLLRPARVEVLNAWLANPITSLHLPPQTIADVEQHAGATLRYTLADGQSVIMNYERASGTHSEEQSVIEITGLRGSVSWSWPLSRGRAALTHIYDRDGASESRTIAFPPPAPDTLRFGEKPLVYFYRYLHNQPSSAIVNEQALFNFACLRAIYDCASSGQAQTVDAQTLL
ncbi:MAG TPA: Gfo/Idh/MocA family oxidoreductase [Ktedonobacteraceae bacterium]|nr:Gfo/Idh/MocA family oxidoreductase [Ktedonobacteraceae bacterium]